MRSCAVKSKKFPRYVEVDDVALAVLERSAEPDHALNQEENILDRVAFQKNDLVASVADRTTPESENAARRLRVVCVNQPLRNLRPQIHNVLAELDAGLERL